MKVDGSTVSWKMSCEKSGMTGTGKITYSGDAYNGTMHMKMQDHEVTATTPASSWASATGRR